MALDEKYRRVNQLINGLGLQSPGSVVINLYFCRKIERYGIGRNRQEKVTF